MDEQQQAAYIIAMSACATIKAMGMVAENQQRLQHGESIAYNEEAFDSLIREYGIHHNGVFGTYRR